MNTQPIRPVTELTQAGYGQQQKRKSMSYTHVTAPTQYVEAGGVRHAYRRFGKTGNAPPLVFCVHFRLSLIHI